MLAHPTLITASTVRSIPRVHDLSMAKTAKLIGRSEVTLYSWHHFNARADDAAAFANSPRKYPGSRIPQYVSAYLQLLANTHPTHTMHWRADGNSSFPVLFATDRDTVLAWRKECGVTVDDILTSFGFKEDTKQHSVYAIGGDGVRWLMLRLMAGDVRCGAVVKPRAAPSAITPAAEPASTATQE